VLGNGAIDEVETALRNRRRKDSVGVAAVAAEDCSASRIRPYEGYQAGYQEGRKRAQQDADAVKRTLASMGSLSMLDYRQDILDLSLKSQTDDTSGTQGEAWLFLPMVREAANSLQHWHPPCRRSAP
jgi:hypothetical protein